MEIFHRDQICLGNFLKVYQNVKICIVNVMIRIVVVVGRACTRKYVSKNKNKDDDIRMKNVQLSLISQGRNHRQ